MAPTCNLDHPALPQTSCHRCRVDPLVGGSQSELAVPVMAPTEHLPFAVQGQYMWPTSKGKLTHTLTTQFFNLAWLQPATSIGYSFSSAREGMDMDGTQA